MAATSAAACVYASNASTVASTLPFSTTHIYWGSKVWTLLLSVRKYSWGLLPLWFNCLVQSILIICCGGIILARLYSGSFVILLWFKIGSLSGFTLIFVWMLDWGSGRSLSSPPNLGLTGSCSDYLLVVIGRVGLMVVWCCFANARMALLLITLNCRSNSTVSCNNEF